MSSSLAKAVWRTSKREFEYSDQVLVMGILNVTPDSFSDGGKFSALDAALRHAEILINEGANILDVGGESTRPNATRIDADEEAGRVVPVIREINKRFDIAISIDTSKSTVAKRAIEAGAEIINDISGLRFDRKIADVAARDGVGLVLMHSRGDFNTMHTLPPVEDILEEVSTAFDWSIERARKSGVNDDQICLDVGIGFSKTLEQNIELIAGLTILRDRFTNFPLLIGTSRKSFIGKILGDSPVDKRLAGTIASNVFSIINGARIIRVHDVEAHVEAIKVIKQIIIRS